jgi:hypothetical protein
MSQLLDEIGAAKNIRVVNKAASSEGVGQSTSPTEKLDGGVRDVTTGDRASENDADLRKAVPGNNVIDTKIRDFPNYNQIQLGTKKTPTGEDPSTERDLAGRPIDSETSSPANADFGEKYSSMAFDEMRKVSNDLANKFIDGVLNGEVLGAAPSKGSTEAEKQAAIDPNTAAAAGYNLASAVADGTLEGYLKEAAVQTVASAIQEGYARADLIAPIIFAGIKQANDEAGQAAMAGNLPPEVATGGAPGGMPPGGPGGPGGPGEMSPGGEGGEGGQDQDAEINEIANLLIEQGIPIEALLEKLQQMDPATEVHGENMEQKQANCAALIKMAKQVDKHLCDGKFRLVRAPRGSKQAAERAEAAAFIRETLRI